MSAEAGILTATSTSASTGLNFSLFKVGPLMQVLAGATFASMALTATTLTVIVVATTSSFAAPVLNPDEYITTKSNILKMNVLLNDYDPKGGVLKIARVTQPRYGTVMVDPGNFLTYTPKNMGKKGKHYRGIVTFEYTVINEKLESTTNVTVDIRNHLPEPVELLYVVPMNIEGFKAAVLDDKNKQGKKAQDIDQDEIFITRIIRQPPNGVLTIAEDKKSVKYTPNKGFTNAPSGSNADTLQALPDSGSYEVSDGDDSTTTDVGFIVTNEPPVANLDYFYDMPINTVLTGLNVLENDYDPNGDPLTIVAVQSTGGTPVIAPDGKSVDFYPFPGIYHDGFFYTITDGKENTQSFADIKMVNKPPVAGTINLEIPKNSDDFKIDLIYSDPDPHTTLTVTIATPPVQGTYILSSQSEAITTQYLPGYDMDITYTNNTYTLTYSPQKGKLYDDVIVYTVSDGKLSVNGKINIKVVNTPPVAIQDFSSSQKNNKKTINLVINDKDDNGDALRIKSTSSCEKGGTVTVISDYDVEFTPKPFFAGVDTFSYIVTDIQEDMTKALTSEATVIVAVNNTAPVANPDTFTSQRGLTNLLNVLANDNDINEDSLEIFSFDDTSSSGVPLKVVDNKIEYKALSGAPYVDTFKYKCTDRDLESNEVTVTVNVVNSVPVAVDDAVTMKWNTQKTIDVLSNDKDVNPGDYEKLEITNVSNATNGAVSVDSNKRSITYKPNTGFVGQDSFTYAIADGIDGSNTATVSIDVQNNAPVAQDDSYNSHHFGTTKVYDVLQNDSDPDSDSIWITSVATPTHGVAALEDGKIKYTATSDLGVQTFQYTVTDGNKFSTATVSVTCTNTVPQAAADVATVHWKSVEGVQINVLDNDSDTDLDTLSVQDFTTPAKGSVTKNGDVLTYKPDGSSSGSFSFEYTISDGASTATGTVTVTVRNSDKPSAAPISSTIHWRKHPTVVKVTETGTDSDGDSLTVSSTTPEHGAVTNQTDSSGAVSFSYTQNQPYKGSDSFSYTVSDGLDEATAVISFTITNQIPVAKSYNEYLHATNAEEGLVIEAVADATDADAADVPYLQIKIITAAPSHGSVVIQNNGKDIKYVPNEGYVGADSFKYTITDGLDDSLEATVVVDNLPPALSFKKYSKHWKKSQTTGNVLFVTENIIDPFDNKTLHLTGVVNAHPTSGLISFEPAEVIDDVARVYKVNYTSNAGFVGTDSFKLQMSNIAGDNKPELTVEVKVTNQAPTAEDATASIHWAATSGVEISILTGASDPDSEDKVEYDSHTTPTCGHVTENDGKLTFTNQSPAVLGDCTFNFVVTDGLAKITKQATVTVENKAPVALAKTFDIQWTEHKEGYTMNLLEGATDGDSDPIVLDHLSALSESDAGTLTQTTNGAIIKASSPSSFVNKAVTFTYTISDGASTDTKLVTVNVKNTAPVANDDTYSFTGTQPQSTFELDVLSNDKDTDPLSIKSFSNSGQGSVSNNNDKLSYKPKDGFVGQDTISYIATDTMSDSKTGYVTITVSNSAPNAVADSAAVQWNKNVKILPLENDSDPENNTPLTLTISEQPNSGSVSVSGNEVTYTPSSSITYTSSDGAKRTTVDTFKYSVTDSYGLSSVGTVSVTVGNTPPTASDKTLTFDKTAANPTREIDVIGAVTTDADGDPITISSISYTSGKGAAVTIVDNKVHYKPASNFRGEDEVTFVLSDGQLTASAKISIVVENQKPVCGPISRTVDKQQTYIWDLKTLGLASDPNGDEVSIQLDSSNVYDKADVSIHSAHEVKFISKAERSGMYVFKYVCYDGILASDPQTVTVTIHNRVPVAVNDEFSAFKIQGATHSVEVLANDSDPDMGDILSLVSVTIADSSAGVVSVEGNRVKFVPADSFAGTTTATYTIKDSDSDNSKTATATLTLQVIEALPVVKDDLIKIDWNTPAVISIESLLANDEPPAGMSVRFHSLVDCDTLDNDIYCLFDKKPVLNSPSAGHITVNYHQNSCRENKFKYCVDTDKLPGTTVCGTVTVKYINCECRGKVDVVFALDSSGSMSYNDWRTQVDFAKNISKAVTKNMYHPNDIKIGVVQFSTTSKIRIGLANHNAILHNKLNGMKSQHMRGWTGTKLGLNDAVKVHDTNGGRKGIPKVIVVMSDGVANRPCDCHQCDDVTKSPPEKVPCSDKYGVWCQPCASPVARAQEINSWRRAAGQDARWKVIAMGLGKDLHNYNNLGWNLLKGMNYDPEQTLLVNFENLNKAVEAIKAVQLVVDEVCSISE